MKQKLIDCINGVLKHLPWGEISSHTAEDIAERLIEEELVTGTNVGGKWIPVDERLPNTFGEFIVCVQNADGRRFSDYADFDPYVKKWKTGLFCGEHDKVTHWMPLPEPPKEEQ